MEVESPLNTRKPCPKCDGQMQYIFSWIEHDGFGHPGSPIAWSCMKCKHREEFEKPDLLPCPFCGKQPRVVEDTSYGDCQVFCVCDAEPCIMREVGHLEEAKKLWNTRAFGLVGQQS
jgi:ssDNA-binding Zn-finger/Zn-ribbon topoisomerase 1